MSILKLFGLAKADHPAAAETSAVRKITEVLDRLPPAEAKYLAAFAYILSRVAHADQEASEEETREMQRILMEQGRLPEEQAAIVVAIAKAQSLLFGGTEDFLVTREFAAVATREQKLGLLGCLFAVSSSDRRIDTVEDNEVRRIARELKIEHADFIRIRSSFRRHLGFLSHPPRVE